MKIVRMCIVLAPEKKNYMFQVSGVALASLGSMGTYFLKHIPQLPQLGSRLASWKQIPLAKVEITWSLAQVLGFVLCAVRGA